MFHFSAWCFSVEFVQLFRLDIVLKNYYAFKVIAIPIEYSIVWIATTPPCPNYFSPITIWKCQIIKVFIFVASQHAQLPTTTHDFTTSDFMGFSCCGSELWETHKNIQIVIFSRSGYNLVWGVSNSQIISLPICYHQIFNIIIL